jgi:cation diffusion facilitator family transporter
VAEQNTKDMALHNRNQDVSRTVREVKQITWIGLVANVLLSAFKVVAGIIGSSQAIVADGIHSLSDTTTDIALLIGVRYWSAPPDQNHPHGHRRIETVITAVIGFVLVLVAIGISYNAIITLYAKHSRPPELIAFIAAVVSIVSKEFLYHWNIRVGRRIKSPAVIANAWHHRSDGLSSIPAAVAVAGASFFPQWYFLDHIGAVIVSVFILHAAWKISWPALKELTDSSAGLEIREQIEKISRDTDGVLGVHKCRTRRHGFGLLVDIHVQVKPDLTVHAGHEISRAVKQRLLEEGPDVIDVIIHIEPHETV